MSSEDFGSLDKTGKAFKNLASQTAYKRLKAMGFRGTARAPEDKAEREARERISEIARLRSVEREAEGLALEADKRGEFKRWVRFWNRMNDARQGLIKLGAV